MLGVAVGVLLGVAVGVLLGVAVAEAGGVVVGVAVTLGAHWTLIVRPMAVTPGGTKLSEAVKFSR